MRPTLIGLIVACLATVARADDDGFVSLFNGNNLTGWVYVNVPPQTFTVKDGIIVTTGIPTGLLRTERQYENFIIELEWRHMKPQGNSGLFLWADGFPAVGSPFTRAIEAQILDGREGPNYTSDGDVFSTQGSKIVPDRPHPAGWERCLPSEKRCKPSPEWNHYRVTCNHGDVKLAVNGKVVSGGTRGHPRKGYLCLEAEGSECHFRNLRIKELPSTNPTADETGEIGGEFQNVYNGLDLAGWKPAEGQEGHWQPKNYLLQYDGKSEADDKNLWSEKSYANFQLICDWRLLDKPVPKKWPVVLPSGDDAKNGDGTANEVEIMDAGDSGIYLRGSSKAQVNIWCRNCGSGEVHGYRVDPSMPATVRAGATPKANADKPPGQWNRFIITLKGSRATVVLNGQTVIDGCELPGIPNSGPIALQHHGSRIEFANVLIRELE